MKDRDVIPCSGVAPRRCQPGEHRGLKPTATFIRSLRDLMPVVLASAPQLRSFSLVPSAVTRAQNYRSPQHHKFAINRPQQSYEN